VSIAIKQIIFSGPSLFLADAAWLSFNDIVIGFCGFFHPQKYQPPFICRRTLFGAQRRTVNESYDFHFFRHTGVAADISSVAGVKE
jgi:hypothetical protein